VLQREVWKRHKDRDEDASGAQSEVGVLHGGFQGVPGRGVGSRAEAGAVDRDIGDAFVDSTRETGDNREPRGKKPSQSANVAHASRSRKPSLNHAIGPDPAIAA
jgi:hypothetical protein